MKNESDVKKIVKHILTGQKDCWWFMPPANGYGRAGIPDFVGCVNGYLFTVETKFGKGTLTANQERELEMLLRSGAKAWVVRETSVDTWAIEFRAWAALCS